MNIKTVFINNIPKEASNPSYFIPFVYTLLYPIYILSHTHSTIRRHNTLQPLFYMYRYVCMFIVHISHCTLNVHTIYIMYTIIMMDIIFIFQKFCRIKCPLRKPLRWVGADTGRIVGRLVWHRWFHASYAWYLNNIKHTVWRLRQGDYS